MNILDYTLLVLVGLSALVGLLRGFVKETVSLLAWTAAFWLAMSYGTLVAERLTGVIHQAPLRVAAAFAALFVTVLLVGLVINHLLGSLLKKTGLQISDRLLGVIFGLARGVLVVGLVMVLVELTPLGESESWRDSTIVGLLQPMISHVHQLLPSGMHTTVAQGFGVFSR